MQTSLRWTKLAVPPPYWVAYPLLWLQTPAWLPCSLALSLLCSCLHGTSSSPAISSLPNFPSKHLPLLHSQCGLIKIDHNPSLDWKWDAGGSHIGPWGRACLREKPTWTSEVAKEREGKLGLVTSVSTESSLMGSQLYETIKSLFFL